MKTLVVDVAAEHGGALTILRQHIDEFKADTSNNYLVLLSRPRFEESDNVKFTYVKGVQVIFEFDVEIINGQINITGAKVDFVK